MIILGIETSCDETGAAVIEAKKNAPFVSLLANVVASSLAFHAQSGGIIPEIAAREQVKVILPVIEETLTKGLYWKKSDKTVPPIDAIAVTVGPGLIGSLLVGVETAKTLSYLWNKPLTPVNHLYGHIYANFIREHSPMETTISFPSIALVVSGGHTDLVLLKHHGEITWLGGTRDDAAGEAFDKIGRLLGLPYPGGPMIEKLSKHGDSTAFRFPRPMIDSDDFDFSFSGLKTAVLRQVKTMKLQSSKTTATICASVQQAIIDVLVAKTLNAVKKTHAKSVLLGGGVAANQALVKAFKQSAIDHTPYAKIFVPPKHLCTDNAAMIASAAFFNYHEVPSHAVEANPELYFD